MGNFNIPNIKNGDKIDNIKSSDLHTRKESNNSTYKSLELLLGNTIGNKYPHDYKKFDIIDMRNEMKLTYTDGSNSGLFKKNIPYNLLDLFMNTSTRVDKEYKYEVVANTNSAMNRVFIPVYVDNSEELVTPRKKDFIQLIQGIDIEINYLEKKETYSIGDLSMDSFLLFDDQSDRDPGDRRYYNYNSHTSNKADVKNVYRHMYIFDGYNRWHDAGVSETEGTWLLKGTAKKGVELTHYEYQTKSSAIGHRSKFSRHRNSTGNHQYKTKVTFFNSKNSSLAMAEQLNNHRCLSSKYGDRGWGIPSTKINFVTHQDMVWGVNKSMIAPNIKLHAHPEGSTWSNDQFDAKYAMTAIPNYPTIYVGFEECGISLPGEPTGMKRIGNIVLTFLNFAELGMFPANRTENNKYWNTEIVYKVKRTCEDFSDNTRFNIKIRVPKRDTNLLYKGQSERGSEIFLIPGHIEYDENIYITQEFGQNKNYRAFFRPKDTTIKMMSIASDTLDNEAHKARVFATSGLSYTPATDEKETAWFFKVKNIELMIHDFSENTPTWRSRNDGNDSIDTGLQFAGPILGNYGGWIIPPFRYSNIYHASLSNNSEYSDGTMYAHTFNKVPSDLTSNGFNAGCYCLSPRDYPISLGPLLNYILAQF